MKLVLFKDRSEERKYEFVETVDTSIHDEINTIRQIDKFWSKTSYDYMFALDRMKSIMNSTGYDNLNDTDKKVCIKNAICTKEQAIALGYTEQEILLKGEEVGGFLKLARKSRIEKARRYISSLVIWKYWIYDQSNDLLATTKDMFENYIEGGNPSFIYWLQSINGYESTGFSSKSYYSEDIKNKFIAIIINGEINA